MAGWTVPVLQNHGRVSGSVSGQSRSDERLSAATGWAAGTNFRFGLPHGKPVAVTTR